MRPLSFRKGTLIIEVPSAAAERCRDLEFRSLGAEWALRLELEPEGRPVKGEVRFEDGTVSFYGRGTYVQSGAEIRVSGHQSDENPDWWCDGRLEFPEPWDRVRLFGRSSQSVRLGSD